MKKKGKYKFFELIYFCLSFIFLTVYGIYKFRLHIDKFFTCIFIHLFIIIIYKLELKWNNNRLLNFFVENFSLTKILLVIGPIYLISPFVYEMIIGTKVNPISVFVLSACCSTCIMTYFYVKKEKEL